MSISPGWYPDPAAPETQRYWDGEQWVGEPVPADVTPPDRPPVRKPDPPPGAPEIRLPPGMRLPPGVELPPGVVLTPAEIPEGFTAASLERRLGARALDALLIGVLCGLANSWLGYRYVQLILPYLRQALRDPGAQPDSRINTLMYGMIIVALAVWFAYEVVATNRNGQTLGKRLLRVKVVAMDGAPVDFRASMRRWMVMAIPFVFPCCLPLALIDVLWCTWDRPLAQCVHDKSARTIVVSAKSADLPPVPPVPPEEPR